MSIYFVLFFNKKPSKHYRWFPVTLLEGFYCETCRCGVGCTHHRPRTTVRTTFEYINNFAVKQMSHCDTHTHKTLDRFQHCISNTKPQQQWTWMKVGGVCVSGCARQAVIHPSISFLSQLHPFLALSPVLWVTAALQVPSGSHRSLPPSLCPSFPSFTLSTNQCPTWGLREPEGKHRHSLSSESCYD